MKYFKYLKYILEHKKNVAIECIKEGMFIHAITHDLSKFRPSEFFAYANYFYGTKAEKNKKKFEMAWNDHQKRNKHHWNYWVVVDRKAVPLEMPSKYVKQMVVDWRGMSRKFGDTATEYFESNVKKMILHENTIIKIKELLYKGWW